MSKVMDIIITKEFLLILFLHLIFASAIYDSSEGVTKYFSDHFLVEGGWCLAANFQLSSIHQLMYLYSSYSIHKIQHTGFYFHLNFHFHIHIYLHPPHPLISPRLSLASL